MSQRMPSPTANVDGDADRPSSAVSRTALRILIVNQYAGSPVHGMEFRAFELAREWAKLGHEVQIVAGFPSHLRSSNPTFGRLVTRELVEGVQFEWFRLPRYSGNGLRRAANVMAFAGLLRRRSARIARRFRPDIVIASSTHPLDTYGARASPSARGARSSSRFTTSGHSHRSRSAGCRHGIRSSRFWAGRSDMRVSMPTRSCRSCRRRMSTLSRGAWTRHGIFTYRMASTLRVPTQDG